MSRAIAAAHWPQALATILMQAARRVAQSALVLWAAFSLSFVILYALPSDPVTIMLNQTGEASLANAQQVAALRAEYHVDQPLAVQYALALKRALVLDFGHSIQTGEPVAQAVLNVLPATAALSLMALLMALSLGVALAVLAHLDQRRWIRDTLLAIPALAVSLPTFWVGLLLLQWLSFGWHWFPAMGNLGLQSLVLPALTLAIPTSAVIAQVLARAMTAVVEQPFVEVLRAKGLSHRQVLLRHVLRNSLIPLLSLSGVIIGNLLAGAVVTETVFSRQGVGRLAQAAVTFQDIPVVQGVVVLAAAIFVAVNLLVDLVYPWLDPRLGGRR